MIGSSFINIDSMHPHEKVLPDRAESMFQYVRSLSPHIVIPSIILCSKTNVIIDGHHRYFALKKLNIIYAPATYINYNDNRILTHTKNNLAPEKKTITSSIGSKVLEPKTSFHHIRFNNELLPIILLSDLMLVQN